MTESEWLACTDPRTMLESLESASDRKLRLFGCGCCRLNWDLLTDERSQWAVEAAEQYADGAISTRQLKKAADAAYDAHTEAKVADGYDADSDLPPEEAGHIPFVAYSTTQETEFAADWALSLKWDEDDRKAQCHLLRCVFGNPFGSVTISPAWLAWNGGTILKLAQDIYKERAFDRMPILADALEDAGCTHAEILSHCRGPEPHVRGCWLIDLLLGKE
jgi:hypothetical protein